jgi:hypothetical protein
VDRFIHLAHEYVKDTRPTKEESFAFLTYMNIGTRLAPTPTHVVGTAKEAEAVNEHGFMLPAGGWMAGARSTSEVADMAQAAGLGSRDRWRKYGEAWRNSAVEKLRNLPAPTRAEVHAAMTSLSSYAGHVFPSASELTVTTLPFHQELKVLKEQEAKLVAELEKYKVPKGKKAQRFKAELQGHLRTTQADIHRVQRQVSASGRSVEDRADAFWVEQELRDLQQTGDREGYAEARGRLGMKRQKPGGTGVRYTRVNTPQGERMVLHGYSWNEDKGAAGEWEKQGTGTVVALKSFDLALAKAFHTSINLRLAFL